MYSFTILLGTCYAELSEFGLCVCAYGCLCFIVVCLEMERETSDDNTFLMVFVEHMHSRLPKLLHQREQNEIGHEIL